MDVKNAVKERRAVRTLGPVEVDSELVEDLAGVAGLAASCFNNQPWRFVFVYGEEKLQELFGALAGGNAWAKKASMLVAVVSRKDDDCVVADREYHLFDTGMATAQVLLRATELGLVAHPMAGFKGARAKKILGVPEDRTLVTLIAVGKRVDEIDEDLDEDAVEAERTRPPRKPLGEIAFKDTYGQRVGSS